MRRLVLAIALFVPACEAFEPACELAVDGELRLSTPVTTSTAVAHATLWQYDPDVAGGAVEPIATFMSSMQRGVQVVPFSLDPAASDDDLAHYVTASVDVDGDGVDELGDYAVTDFHPVAPCGARVILALTPRTP